MTAGMTNSFDVHDNALLTADANGTVVTNSFDLLNRLARRDVRVGPGVAAATTFESFRYDGLSRLVLAQNDASLVTRAYDSLSQKEKEHELQAQQWKGPSGMWTSPHPAKGGAYRYRMMGIGVVLLVGMGYLMFRLIKRANAERAAR